MPSSTVIEKSGRLAQLGERRVRNAEVRSSILLPSTNFLPKSEPGQLSVHTNQASPAIGGSGGGDLDHHGLMVHIKTLRSIAVSMLLCLFAVSHRTDAAAFEIQHDTSYARMTLPSVLGDSTELQWGLTDPPMSLGINGEVLEVVSIAGEAHIGPLISLDAKRNSDGSLGDADYVFGKGTFALEVLMNLLDGTQHTMKIRGTTGRMRVNVQDDDGSPTGEFSVRVPHARVDRATAALFGMKRHVSGEMPYYVDVFDLPDNEREVALFGTIHFDYEPAPHQRRALAATAVPEPALVGLLGLGLAAVVRRRR